MKGKYSEIYDKLIELYSSKNNFAAYRQHPKESPMIPYIGLVLQDLTFIEDGNKQDSIESPSDCSISWVNMRKMKLLASVYSFISHAKEGSYEVCLCLLQPTPNANAMVLTTSNNLRVCVCGIGIRTTTNAAFLCHRTNVGCDERE
jgi:hypothetical protein